MIAQEQRQAWLDIPRVAARYAARGLVDDTVWEARVPTLIGHVPKCALELGAGGGERSFRLYENGWALAIDGIEASEDLVLAAERARESCRAPGEFRVGHVDALRLPAGRYDLVFACQTLHHAAALERALDQIHGALTPGGVFVIEGYVGPSRFQWTDAQLALVRLVASWMPERLRRYRWGVLKAEEGRPPRAAVAAASPVAAVRSAEILPLVRRRFDVLAERRLGGTIQHLLYNGIAHNFADDDPEGNWWIERIAELESTLVDTSLLPSDFALVVCRKR